MSERERALLARVAELEREAQYRTFTSSAGLAAGAPGSAAGGMPGASLCAGAAASGRTWEWVGQASPQAERAPTAEKPAAKQPCTRLAAVPPAAPTEAPTPVPVVDATPPTSALHDPYPVA